MYQFFKNIFYLTLLLYVLTLIFASYVGVYLTYVAVPVIVISGLFTYFLEPKDIGNNYDAENDDENIENLKSELDQVKKRLKELDEV